MPAREKAQPIGTLNFAAFDWGRAFRHLGQMPANISYDFNAMVIWRTALSTGAFDATHTSASSHAFMYYHHVIDDQYFINCLRVSAVCCVVAFHFLCVLTQWWWSVVFGVRIRSLNKFVEIRSHTNRPKIELKKNEKKTRNINTTQREL